MASLLGLGLLLAGSGAAAAKPKPPDGSADCYSIHCAGEATASDEGGGRIVVRTVTADSGAPNGERNFTVQIPAPPPPKFDEFTDAYLPLQRAGGVCGMAGFGGSDTCRLRLSTDPAPPAPDPEDPDPETVTYITITPYQAALMAAAYLPLEPGQPEVGPPPTINKWKTAAVGYPLWIWAEGNLDPAPVSRSVSGLSVSLDANLARVVYDMGDGTTITCGPGTPWRRGAVPAGTPSPDCGHTYSEPSLPTGDYTITATTHWSVAWTAGGQSGTIPFTQTSSTTLPVGEIQTLVR